MTTFLIRVKSQENIGADIQENLRNMVQTYVSAYLGESTEVTVQEE